MKDLATDLDQAIFAVLGRLIPGLAHELNNPIGFIGSNLETLSGYVEELEGFLNECETKLDGPSAKKFRELRDERDVDFVIEDLRSIASESSGGIDKLKSLVSSVQTQFGKGEGESDRVNARVVVERTLQVLRNELKYTVKTDFSADEEIFVQCSNRDLAYVVLVMVLQVFELMGKEGLLRVEACKVGDDCVIAVSAKSPDPSESPEISKRLSEDFTLALDLVKTNGWRMAERREECSYELRLPRV